MIYEKKARNEIKLQSFNIPVHTQAILFSGDRWGCINYGIVAYDDDHNPVGLATIALNGEFGSDGTQTLVGLWVDPKWRNKGVGRELAIQAAYESGYDFLRADVITQNALKALGGLSVIKLNDMTLGMDLEL